MANTANAGKDIIKDGEPLNEMLDNLQVIRSKVEEIETARGGDAEQFTVLKSAIDKIEKRCDFLDGKLPRGSRVFSADGPVDRQEASEIVGKLFTAAWSIKTRKRFPDNLPEVLKRTPTSANQYEGQDNVGGYLVPSEVYNQVIRLVGEASLARRLCLTIPMNALSMRIPVRSSGPAVFWPGEGIAPDPTSVVFDGPTLTAKTLMAIEELTMELDEDSVVNLEPLFAQLFTEAVSSEENKQLFSSTSPFTGIVQTSNVNTVYLGGSSTSGADHFSAVTYTDLVNLMYSVDPTVIGRGVFVMSTAAFSWIVGLKNSQGTPIYATSYPALPQASLPDIVSGAPGYLMGRPCYFTNQLPVDMSKKDTAMVIYGDFSKHAFGDRKSLSIEFSDQVFWKLGGLGIRVRERIALVNMIADAFGILKTAAS